MGILGRFRLDGKKALVTIRHGIRVNVCVSKVGSHEWLLDQCGLSARKIAGAGRGSGFAADESSYVNGAIVRADGGITIAPIA